MKFSQVGYSQNAEEHANKQANAQETALYASEIPSSAKRKESMKMLNVLKLG